MIGFGLVTFFLAWSYSEHFPEHSHGYRFCIEMGQVGFWSTVLGLILLFG